MSRSVAALLIVVAAALAAFPAASPAQQRAGAAPRPQPPRAAAADPDSAIVAREDARYYERALSLRRRILASATWADLGGVECKPGALRVFPNDPLRSDSARAAAGANRPRTTLDDVEELERVIIARGVENSLDTPAGRDLLNMLIGWESGATRPSWDVPAGQPTRTAIATGLTGQFLNPETRRCETYVALDTMAVILPPEAERYTAPTIPRVLLRTYVGEEGLKRARDQFYSEHEADAHSLFIYTRVRVAIVWRDFAVVAVNRPAEIQGAAELRRGQGGAAYIFRRVGTQWRLLTITRTWG